MSDPRPWTLEDQHRLEATVHYRNLAIRLGAKPEQMISRFDRDLCARGLSDSYDWDVMPPIWAEWDESICAARAEVEAVRTPALRLVDLIDRCQLYGPADAVRGAARQLRAALAPAAFRGQGRDGEGDETT